MNPAALANLLDLTSTHCRGTDVSDATPEELDHLAQSCEVVRWEIDGLAAQIEATKRNGTEVPHPIRPVPPRPRPKPEVHPKPQSPPKEDQ